MSIDLNLLSLHRQNGQEQSAQPGLSAYAPPRRAPRGREREALLVSLLLNGNRSFSAEEYESLTDAAAAAFYGAHGSLTAALRAAAESINNALLERNLSTTGRGQYAIGWLTLAALRDSRLTVLQCGPAHVLAFSDGASRHIYDPALSGKGLGLGQSFHQYFSQVSLQPGDRLLVCPKLPLAWENALESDRGLPAPEATRKRMLSIADGDVSGALIHATDGAGFIRFLTGESAPLSARKPDEASQIPDASPAFPEIEPPPTLASPPPAHVVGRPPEGQPSAYAIPPQSDDEELVERLASAALARQFPASIPRADDEPGFAPIPEAEEEVEFEAVDIASAQEAARRRIESQRQVARAAMGGIQAWRNASERIGAALRKFLPNLLPGGESDISLPIPAMTFISILVPLLVVTVAIVMYVGYGSSSQYDTFMAQAQAMRAQASQQTDPVRALEDWKAALSFVKQAETHNQTDETIALRREAQAQVDALMGVTRLRFGPIFDTPLDAQISRMAASDTDLFMLDAAKGEILRAAIGGNEYTPDKTFDCRPNTFGSLTVDSLVDLLALPKVNTLNSSVLGVDAAGNLLYCAPGQVARPMSLTPPPTNWGRVTAMALDAGKLYVLDAPARAVWIYTDKEGVFTDAPLFFFGAQIPDIEDAIDIAVSGDELYLLHADGSVTFCSYSRIDSAPTRCESPALMINSRFEAYGAANVFEQAHFTQMTLTDMPDSTLLLLDADGQAVYRLSSRGFELQGILGAAPGALPQGPLGALIVAPNHALYLASGGRVFVALDAP